MNLKSWLVVVVSMASASDARADALAQVPPLLCVNERCVDAVWCGAFGVDPCLPRTLKVSNGLGRWEIVFEEDPAIPSDEVEIELTTRGGDPDALFLRPKMVGVGKLPYDSSWKWLVINWERTNASTRVKYAEIASRDFTLAFFNHLGVVAKHGLGRFSSNRWTFSDRWPEVSEVNPGSRILLVWLDEKS